MSARGSGGSSSLASWERLLRASRGAPRWDITSAILYRIVPSSILGDKAGRSGDLTDACSPIMLPVTVGLGGSMAIALNALTSIPTTGGGGRFFARGPSTRASYFRIRRSLDIEPLSIRWLSSPYPFAGPCLGVRGHD